MDAPALLNTSFQSARYEITSAKWKDVDIEVYYDKHHPYNVEQMIIGVKKSLDYYSDNFGVYPFKQLRIVEFPRYMDGAQGFANTLTFSERRDFIAAPESGKGNSMNCFFTVAHEVAHQWWGHQVVSADLPGNTLIGESLAEYSALKVLEKEFGEKTIHRYLAYELDEYLRERRRGDNEPVLLYCQYQPEVYYNKASIVLYSLSDLIGEQKMNEVLRAYVKKNAFQQAPYTTSLELEKVLLAATPDSLKYAITDGFEKITFYENRMKEVSFVKLPSGKYKVSIVIDAMKLNLDKQNKTNLTAMNDYIDIGIFEKGTTDNNPLELYNEKHKIKSGLNTIEIIVDKKPYEAGIDPYSKLIDKNTNDNLKKMTNKTH
jgi:ABC-2 type transport system permease protein